LEDLIYEIIYPKTFKTDEDFELLNIQLQEKLFILQNMVTPEMLGINQKHYAFNVYQLSINELKKINSVKSPINKCSVVTESINVLSSLFSDQMPGADEIFPILLYCVLSTNPPY
jgi:hypothetical protein